MLLCVGGHVAVVLPGGSAGPNSAPLLIPSLAAEQSGIAVEAVAYPDFRPESLERDAARAFDVEVFDLVRRLVTSRRADRVTFIAKSRGTLFLSTMLPLDGVACDAIWVTPLFGLDYVCEGFVDKGWRSLVVAGGGDRYHDATAHERVCAAVDAESVVIEGADHRLVVDGNATATVAGLARLCDASLRFFAS